MCDKNAIIVTNLGKMYKLYKKPKDKILDAFGLSFWKKNYYKEFWALREVNIVIKKGERVGIIGHNGAGKSTFLKTLIGNIEPNEGEIKINGDVQALMELGTGFHPDFTGKENIRASLAYHGLSAKEIKEKEDEIIDFAELGDYIDQPVKTYSAGMYARLAFSTSTAIEPEVLIIDEVLGAGDAYFSGKSIERMRSLTNKENTTVLFVSHDLSSVQALCERIIWIDKGRVRYDGNALTAIKRYSDVVRENQENRLRIRDKKVAKKQAIILDKEQELYFSMLFCLSSSSNIKAKVRKLFLICGEEELARIDVGMPMDNDNKDKNHILDEIEKMCWCDSDRDEQGFYRIFDSQSGEYRHAPFVMTLSKALSLSGKLYLKIQGEIIDGNDMKVEIFDTLKQEYTSLGQIFSFNKSDFTEEVFYLPHELYKDICREVIEVEEKFVQNEKIEFQDSEKCKICSAFLYDNSNVAKQVFSFEKQISRVSFNIKFLEKINKFTIAFLIFTMRGDIVISQCKEIIVNHRKTDFDIDLMWKCLRLGTGTYTISLGIYDTLDYMDNSKSQSAIALIDRGLSFEIEQPLSYRLNTGNVIPDIDIIIKTEKKGDYICNSII